MSSSSYKKVVTSKLSFKGSSKAASSSVGVKRKIAEDETVSSTAHSAAAATISVEKGIGRITSSGTTIQGHESRFMDQLSVGDAIVIRHPTSMREETKIVRMVLSNISIGVSSAFSSDIVSTTAFQFVKAPKDMQMSAEELEERQAKKQHQDEVAAFGTYASKGGEEVVYRVRKPGAFGGYAIVKESVGAGSKTREELLNMRSKKKADR